MDLTLPVLLAFVEDCELSDADDEQQQPLPADYTRSSSTDSAQSRSTQKTRPRRDVVEIAALKTQMEGLRLQLAELKAAKRSDEMTLLVGQSPWQIEAQRQSRMRTAAQEENERLRAQTQTQMQIARRLTNVLKRNSGSQMRQMIYQCERDANLSAQRPIDDLDEDLRHVYQQTDAMLADAQMDSLPLVFFDARMGRKNCPGGLSIEFRRCFQIAHDRDTTSDAYWSFIPRRGFSTRFVFEHNVSAQNDAIGRVFLFQCKHGPSQTRFTGRYQLRRYTTESRVVVVWKTLLQSLPQEPSPHVRLHGQGWVVMQSNGAAAASKLSTSVQTFARYHAESKTGVEFTPEQAQQNAELMALVEFVTTAMEQCGEFPAQMATRLQ